MGRFEGKIAIVTGANRPPGIGTATAQRLGAEGATVVCVDRVADDALGGTDSATREDVAELLQGLRDAGAQAHAVDADIASSTQVESLLSEVVDLYGRVDVCCCLPYFLARAVAGQMRKQGSGGAITFLSSYAGIHSTPQAGAIGAARAGLNFLVQVMAEELGPSGIRVNAVCPLGVASPDNSGLRHLTDRAEGDQGDWARSHIPLARLQTAEETAALITYLSSDDASFVSGQSVSVAGGAPG
jgi:NAD(P)-dependent dehydrogenase (short-subunit alcohol dehydrogenase family)